MRRLILFVALATTMVSFADISASRTWVSNYVGKASSASTASQNSIMSNYVDAAISASAASQNTTMTNYVGTAIKSAVPTNLVTAINGQTGNVHLVAFEAFKPEWPHINTNMDALCAAIQESDLPVGSYFLGELANMDPLPIGIGNAEVTIRVPEPGLYVFDMTSTDTQPYKWEGYGYNDAFLGWRQVISVPEPTEQGEYVIGMFATETNTSGRCQSVEVKWCKNDAAGPSTWSKVKDYTASDNNLEQLPLDVNYSILRYANSTIRDITFYFPTVTNGNSAPEGAYTWELLVSTDGSLNIRSEEGVRLADNLEDRLDMIDDKRTLHVFTIRGYKVSDGFTGWYVAHKYSVKEVD